MARVNIEERCFAENRIRGLAIEMNWTEHHAMGVMVYLWHGSQEAVRPGGGPEEIRRWAFIRHDEIDRFLSAACAFHLLEQKNDGFYEIVGNRHQIETRLSRMKAGIKGAKATKKKWEAVRPAVGLTKEGPIQGNSIQGNSIQKLYPSDIVDAGQSPSVDHRAAAEFLNIWNSNRGALPKVEKLNIERRRRIKTRLTQNPDLEYWVATIKRMAASDFCCSGNWATIDWLIANDTNHMKVNEGKYDNRLRTNGSGGKTIKAMTDEEIQRMCAEADAEAAAEDAKFGITRQ